MKQIRVSPSWIFKDSEGNTLNPQLFDLLKAIRDTGKLTDAAKASDISYRHGWNLIQKWTEFFGTPLVDQQKGRGTQLTHLGNKLLWAEERVNARLGPQLENIASEVNLEIHQALNPEKPLINIFASYGYAIAKLGEAMDSLQVNLQYMPAENAIAALCNDECHAAGFHIPWGLENSSLYEKYHALLEGKPLSVVHFITRKQGLMTKRGNPKQIRSLNDLIRPDVSFVNRQFGSGTSDLFDELLAREGISTKRVKGYSTREFTHSAIAAYVASGMADTGLGVQPPAEQFGLDFVPIAEESYLLVLKTDSLEDPGIQLLLDEVRSEIFAAKIDTLPGYQKENLGKVSPISWLLDALKP